MSICTISALLCFTFPTITIASMSGVGVVVVMCRAVVCAVGTVVMVIGIVGIRVLLVYLRVEGGSSSHYYCTTSGLLSN